MTLLGELAAKALVYAVEAILPLVLPKPKTPQIKVPADIDYEQIARNAKAVAEAARRTTDEQSQRIETLNAAYERKRGESANSAELRAAVDRLAAAQADIERLKK